MNRTSTYHSDGRELDAIVDDVSPERTAALLREKGE